jgi:hypothetical protein
VFLLQAVTIENSPSGFNDFSLFVSRVIQFSACAADFGPASIRCAIRLAAISRRVQETVGHAISIF